jgi:hypothetical protein
MSDFASPSAGALRRGSRTCAKRAPCRSLYNSLVSNEAYASPFRLKSGV